MNGIYDFENHRTPYLDVEMLMERKAKKTKKILLMFATITMILMVALLMNLTLKIVTLGSTAVSIMCFVYFIYGTVGIILIERVVKKKGEKICQ